MENKMRRGMLIITAGLFLFLVGCSWFQHEDEKTALELAQEGMELYDAGKYRKAIESFETIKDWYPFSKFAMLAELKLADSYYRLKEYDEAATFYEEFENLHPKNEAVPYVIYMLGRCYFDRLKTVDRDQTYTQKALEIFDRLIRQYPADQYAARARQHVKTCLNNLAAHEFYVGNFYFKTKNYKAALKRFESVLTDFPDTGIHYKAIRLISECRKRLNAGAAGEKY